MDNHTRRRWHVGLLLDYDPGGHYFGFRSGKQLANGKRRGSAVVVVVDTEVHTATFFHASDANGIEKHSLLFPGSATIVLRIPRYLVLGFRDQYNDLGIPLITG